VSDLLREEARRIEESYEFNDGGRGKVARPSVIEKAQAEARERLSQLARLGDRLAALGPQRRQSPPPLEPGRFCDPARVQMPFSERSGHDGDLLFAFCSFCVYSLCQDRTCLMGTHGHVPSDFRILVVGAVCFVAATLGC
jgi:hypothetical protein